MPGLVPGIPIIGPQQATQDVHGRDKSGQTIF
jgi:hypothetical protein